MRNEVKRSHIRRLLWNIAGWAGVLLAAACMVGLLVAVVMLALEKGDFTLLLILAASFAGGAVLLGAFGFLMLRLGERMEREELDAREREDGEGSFFIGEGTLATFEKDALRIHGEGKNEITVPYGEIRFFSVCARRLPKEAGDWCVVFEIPARFLVKKGKAKRDDPPLLVQTAAKPRLYDCIAAHGLTLLGEKREDGRPKKFERIASYTRPDAAKRKRSALLLAFGGALFAAGIGLMFKWTTIGAVAGVVGLYIAARALISFLKARSVFAIYREGIFYREPSGADNAFLKWEEIGAFSLSGEEKRLRAECLYGAYEFPAFEGAYDYLKEHYPEKCEGHERA